jgi:hypothetical protein
MKIIQYNHEGVVVDILNARSDATMDSLALVDGIPPFTPREGYNGVLMYGTSGESLYWDYVAVPEPEPTVEEKAAAYDILMGVGE